MSELARPGIYPGRLTISLAVLLLVLGLASLVGGLRLVAVGGSVFYVVSGLMAVTSGVLLWRGHPWSRRLYAAMLLVAVAWAVWEAGPDGRALLPRLWIWFVVGAAFLTPSVRRWTIPDPAGARPARTAGRFVAGLVAAIAVGAAAHGARPDTPAESPSQAGTRASTHGSQPGPPRTGADTR